MKPYAPERKEAILKKLALPGSLSVTELAQQEGIPRKTLYHWRKQARDQGLLMPNQAESAVYIPSKSISGEPLA